MDDDFDMTPAEAAALGGSEPEAQTQTTEQAPAHPAKAAAPAAAPAKQPEVDPGEAVIAKMEAAIASRNGTTEDAKAQPTPKATPGAKEPEKATAKPSEAGGELKGDAKVSAMNLLRFVGVSERAMVLMGPEVIAKAARNAAIEAMKRTGEYAPEEIEEWKGKPDALLLWKGAKIAKKQHDTNKLIGARGAPAKTPTIEHGRTQQGPTPTRGGNTRVDDAQPSDGLDDIEDIDLLTPEARKKLAERLVKKPEAAQATPEVHPHTKALRERIWAESLAAVDDEFLDVETHYRAVISAANDLGLSDENLLDLDEPTRIKLVRQAASEVGLAPKSKPKPESKPTTAHNGIPRPGGPKAPTRPMTEEQMEEARITAITRGRTSAERQTIYRQLTGG